MRVRFTRQFSKQYDKSTAKIQVAFDQRLKFFIKNPFHPLLSNHPLGGKYLGYRSINVTGDWRAVFEELGEGENKEVIFVAIGTHSQLYK